jgi:hypothetical protein
MTNKLTAAPPDQAIMSRLSVLLESVNNAYKDGKILDDELKDLYHEAIQTFFDSLDNSITSVTYPIIKGAPADPIDYNVFTNAISKDLKVMFMESGAVDRLISSNFNSIIALKEQLLSTSRRISLKTADYLLYADPKLGNGYFFGDSFNSSKYIDIGSDLLENTECYLSQEEGIVTLPLSGNPERISFAKIIINQNSNGVRGNNQQKNALPHNDLKALGDGEPDTWFEYERVSQYAASDSNPLVLDLTMVFSETKIINHIYIDPVFFGTITPVKIIKLETSLDGKEYISIKDEVPISDFFSEEEEDNFVLSGKSSKYYGIAKYSFLPRRTKFIRIVLEQKTPYSIENNNGNTLYRYAIGLKDINVYSRKFESEGSLISTPLDINGDATKISLWASENPTEDSKLASIRHEISFNDGSTWTPVQPQNRSELLYPEVLNFNNAENNSINTDTEVTSIRHKIVMKREKDAFNGQIVLKSERIPKVDIASIPGFSPFSVSLQESPIPETLTAYLPTLGSFSCPMSNRNGTAGSSPPMDLDFVQFSMQDNSTSSAKFKLPWTNIEDLQHRIRVFINGEQWEYRSKAYGAPFKDLDNINSDSKIYFLNKGGREIQFSQKYGDEYVGKLPGAGARIEVCLDGDNPPMTKTDAGYTLNLAGASDGFKKNTTIVTPLQLYSEDIPQPTEWVSSTLYNLGEFVISTEGSSAGAGYVFKCRKAGTSGSIEPDWDTEINNSTMDSSIVWVRTNTGGTIGEWQTIFLSSQTKTFNVHQYIYAQNQGTKDQESGFIAAGSGENNLSIASKEGAGMALPTFGWEYELLEYAPGNNVSLSLGDPASYGMQEVEYIDGYTEFYDGDADETNNWKNMTWSFDKAEGILHFATPIYNHRYRNRFKFKVRHSKVKTIDDSKWNFYKDPVTGKVDTSRIVLDPSSVRQFPITVTAPSKIDDKGVTAISLIGQNSFSTGDNPPSTGMTSLDNMPGHNWSKKRVVRGSIKIASGTIGIGIEPIEVPFIDGRSELLNAVNAQYRIPYQLLSDTNIYEFTIPGISSQRPLLDDVVFEAIVIYPEPVTQSQFIIRVSEENEIVNVGDYYIDDNTGQGKVMVTAGSGGTPLRSHIVKYSYQDRTSGVSTDNLYSVDYKNGLIHFGKENGINGGDITCLVTMYSVFYNMGEVIAENNIEEIDTVNKILKIRPEYGIRFFADSTSGNPVPKYIRLQYEYNKTVTESLKDLEPYFSPICKDIAIRAITKDMIGDI